MVVYLRFVRYGAVDKLGKFDLKLYLCNPRTQERAYEELESFKLSLDDDEPEIRFRVGVAGLQFH